MSETKQRKFQIKDYDGPHDSEPLVAKIQGLADSPLPDEQRLQVLIHLCATMAKALYRETRRHQL